MAEKTYKTIIDQLEGGAILQSYGSKYLVSVNPAPSIHKVRWSIVELNTGGKVYSNFFMSMEQMRQLCDEIEKGYASKKLAADKDSAYPGAYKYVTGENGSKKLNIGGGQKGIRIQIQENVDGKWDNKMSVIPIADFVQMKFLFFLTMGLTLSKTGSYYSSLYDAFWKGEADRAKLHQKTYNEKEDSEYIEPEKLAEKPTENSAEEASPIEEDNSKVSSTPIVPAKNEEVNSSVKEEIQSDFSEITEIQLKVVNCLKKADNGNYKMVGLNREGRSVITWFKPNITENKELWDKFTPIGEKIGAKVTMTGKLKDKDGQLHFLADKIAI